MADKEGDETTAGETEDTSDDKSEPGDDETTGATEGETTKEGEKKEPETAKTEEGEGPQDVDTQYHEKEGEKKGDNEKEKIDEKPKSKEGDKKETKGKESGEAGKGKPEDKGGPKKVYIMRHAERLDMVFPGWLKLAFADKKKYRPYDLNQPMTLPKRDGVPEAFNDDSPITEMGYVTAQMVGRGMRVTKTQFTAIYVSPALRCIQTGHGILKTLNVNLKLRVEPGLFEWLGHYSSFPRWMTKKELISANFQIDPDYKPEMTEDELKKKRKETGKESYQRTEDVIQKILKKHKDPGPILFIGHGSTVDAGSRHLLGKKTTDLEKDTLEKIGNHFPYTCVVGMQEEKGGQYKVIHNALPPISHMDRNNRIDRQFLNRK